MTTTRVGPLATAAESRDFAAGTSPGRLARIAAALYLINIIGGGFAIAWSRGSRCPHPSPRAR